MSESETPDVVIITPPESEPHHDDRWLVHERMLGELHVQIVGLSDALARQAERTEELVDEMIAEIAIAEAIVEELDKEPKEETGKEIEKEKEEEPPPAIMQPTRRRHWT